MIGLVAWLSQPANAQAASDPHLLFQNRQDAIVWTRAHAAAIAKFVQATQFAVVDDRPGTPTDPRYPILQGYVHDLWQAATQLFPDQTAGLGEPPVVLVKSEAKNAIVAGDPSAQQVAHAVLIFTGLIDVAGGIEQREAIAGVVAHELAHSIFLHGLPAYQKTTDKFYLPTSGLDASDRPAEDYPYDAQLNADARTWVDLSHDTGIFTSDDLLDLPSQGFFSVVDLAIGHSLIVDLADGSHECQAVGPTTAKWLSYFTLQTGELTFTLDDSKPLQLRQASQAMIDALSACFKTRKVPYIQLLSESTGLSQSFLAGLPEIMQLARDFDSATDVVTALRALVHQGRQKMKQIEAEVDFTKLGYFSFEQHADEVSALIEAQLGRDPLALEGFLSLLEGPASAAQCERSLAGGIIPPIGSISDPHHTNCYRRYNLRRFARRLPGKDVEGFAAQYSRAVFSR